MHNLGQLHMHVERFWVEHLLQHIVLKHVDHKGLTLVKGSLQNSLCADVALHTNVGLQYCDLGAKCWRDNYLKAKAPKHTPMLRTFCIFEAIACIFVSLASRADTPKDTKMAV